MFTKYKSDLIVLIDANGNLNLTNIWITHCVSELESCTKQLIILFISLKYSDVQPLPQIHERMIIRDQPCGYICKY